MHHFVTEMCTCAHISYKMLHYGYLYGALCDFCDGYILSIFFRITWGTLGQYCDCPDANEAILKISIKSHGNQFVSDNIQIVIWKTFLRQHNKTVCILNRIYSNRLVMKGSGITRDVRLANIMRNLVWKILISRAIWYTILGVTLGNNCSTTPTVHVIT